MKRNRTRTGILSLKKLKEGEYFEEHYPKWGKKEGDFRGRYEKNEYTLKKHEDHIRIYAVDPRYSGSEWYLKFYDEPPRIFKQLNDIKEYLVDKLDLNN